MKRILILMIMAIAILLCACPTVEGPETPETPETPTSYTFNGKVQKGPFITGTLITVNELNENLTQTGKTFSTQIEDNLGSFELNNVEMESSLVLLTASGFFFDEVNNILPQGQLTLQAVTDLEDRTNVNINTMTYVIKGRVENLVANGNNFNTAIKQAQEEFLVFMGINDNVNKDFSELDISTSDDFNGILLAFSVLVNRKTNDIIELSQNVAVMQELLSNLSNDFKDNGIIDNTSLVDKMLANAATLNMPKIGENLTKRYSEQGLNIEVPNYERYINLFKKKYDENIITEISYPLKAYPYESYSYPIYGDEGLINILSSENNNFVGVPSSYAYSVAALIPFDEKVKIVIKSNSEGFFFMAHSYIGWTYSREENTWTFISNKENSLVTGLCHFNGNSSATIEYYENSETITFSREIFSSY